MNKKMVVRADLPEDAAVRKRMVTDGLEAGFCSFILRKDDGAFSQLGKMDTIYFEDGEPVNPHIEYIRITNPEEQTSALELAGDTRLAIVETGDWSIIPLENMIAKYRGSSTKIYAVAHNPKDAETYLRTMENGTDGIVIDVDDPSELSSFRSILTSCGNEELIPLKVTSIRSLDVGDRVCIDTCSMMEPGEGMLIGSSSNCLFLIQSESEDNGYVAARPFRVNAGAVHSYILVPGGGTRYLSELAGGDPVLICNKNGVGRSASIGRCKVEVRPLLMVEATDGKSTYNVILQNAETIKMVTPDGSKSVTVLKEGDEVLAKVSSGGRHFGMAVEETITEK